MSSTDNPVNPTHFLETDVLIVGGGPVGLFTAYRLGKLGFNAVLVERNLSTSNFPKMDITNERTMEIYRKVGLASIMRSHGVPATHGFNEVFTTGLGQGSYRIARIDGISPNHRQKEGDQRNDGSIPLELPLRISGIIYEKILKSAVDELQNVKSFWGYNFESIEETKDAVYSAIHDPNGKPIVVKSKYTIGCDGAGSRVRSLIGINAPREGIPLTFLLIHFISEDGEKLSKHGKFWHLHIGNEAVVIDQDGKNTYTMHVAVPPGKSLEVGSDPEEFINKQLGGWGKPLDIKVDEVGVVSKWEATVALADSFRSSKGRVFLTGDSAHRLTPAGGHGLNSGIHDVFDLTWKLAANLDGWGGETLLESYNKERRSAAELNIKMVWKAMTEIMLPRFTSTEESGREKLIANSEEGHMARSLLEERIMRGDWIHRQLGTTLGHRYKNTPVIIADTSSVEPHESITEYVPSTWPGVRAPHVVLTDGEKSILDLCGPNFTVVDFTPSGTLADKFCDTAKALNIPLTKVHLPNEVHCRKVWERDVVLVRPDWFVAWRSASGETAVEHIDTTDVLLKVVGKA